ncbi:AAA family ATPase [Mycobacterium malmoense]|uniref:AAA family ATPase n=1 Tax=Mycobacterium malmoense TaxID=1780 RepID=UPI001C7CC6E7|nr:AAA family ATPase [Mycobacterium malmoense]QZA18669.1 AAA family ATPase [Mycobacterium malmoense]UNB95442.1 AAA family ATPase [Mycobacterium malmoense]
MSDDLLAGTRTMRAMGLVSLGQARSVLDLVAEVPMSKVNGVADLAPTEGWCRPGACAGTALAAECREVLDWARARVDELVGVVEAKEQFAVWCTALELDQCRVVHGGVVRSCAENHMVFLGAPGTAKTAFARVVGEVLFGVGTLTRPQVIVVSAGDIVGGDLWRSAARMRDVCEDARGGVLLIDEAYRLDSEIDGGSWGVEAITTLRACMAAYRNGLVVILAGYPRPMRDFLAAHAGLAARFPVTVTFASYTPQEVVALGRQLAGREHLVVEDSAWDLLGAEAIRLRSIPHGPGTLLDVAGNARYVGEVIAVCRRARTRRLRRLAPSPRDLEQLVCTDPCVLNVSAVDMGRAIAAARPAVAP